MHISWKLWLWWHNVKMAMTFKVGWDWVLLLDCFAKSVSRVFPLLPNPSRRHSLFDWNVHLPPVGNSDSHFLRHGIFFWKCNGTSHIMLICTYQHFCRNIEQDSAFVLICHLQKVFNLQNVAAAAFTFASHWTQEHHYS